MNEDISKPGEVRQKYFFIDNLILNIFHSNVISLDIDIHEDILERKTEFGRKTTPVIKILMRKRLLVCYSGQPTQQS